MSLVKSTLSNDELIAKCREWISRLCKSGGRDWVITIPPRVNEDPDILFAELCNRFKQSSPSSSAGVEAELDSLAKEKDYWYNRCFQAEAFIDASPFDPGMTPEQIDAYRIWLESKKR